MANQQIFQLNISRVDGPVFSGEAVSVTVPGVEGEMTILANHTALISPLTPGKITVKRADGAEEEFDISLGTLEVSQNSVSVIL